MSSGCQSPGPVCDGTIQRDCHPTCAATSYPCDPGASEALVGTIEGDVE